MTDEAVQSLVDAAVKTAVGKAMAARNELEARRLLEQKAALEEREGRMQEVVREAMRAQRVQFQKDLVKRMGGCGRH